jgi:probable rRNA maturation factor
MRPTRTPRQRMLDVRVQYGVPRSGWPGPRLLHRAARAAWRNASPAQVTLRLVDHEEGERLNREFRGKRSATNVLSFPAPEVLPATGSDSAYLGDIVLCAPVLSAEADEQRKSLRAHFAHMVVHGMLHLQGMDHQEPREAEAMESIECEILAALGFADPYA